jgi:nucleotide-binding universal stress UspA family protein
MSAVQFHRFISIQLATVTNLNDHASGRYLVRTEHLLLRPVWIPDMSLLVPFDGSSLAAQALERASTFGDLLDEDVITLTVIPDDDEYARERGWIGDGEPFDPDAIASGMQSRVDAVDPAATFRVEQVTSDEPTATATTNVVREIRRIAGEVDASVVFIGSENAGSVIAPQSSVGSPVANDQRYDVYVVRQPGRESEPVTDIDSVSS